MKKIVPLIASVIITTIIFGAIYVSVQQSYRQNANDPQIDIAQNISELLAQGQNPNEFIQGTTDIGTSLSTFVIVYDDTGQVLATTGILDGTAPTPPPGVLETARNEQNRVTWQPRADVRIASVIEHYNGATPGFVLVGRSLREVENRIQQLTLTLVIAWAVSIAVIIISALLLLPKTTKPSKPNMPEEKTENREPVQ